MASLSTLLLAVFLFQCVLADVYLHIPRGSNNRLNEKSANRQNADRLFDSQNNNRGGYNAGDKGENAAKNEEEQYRMSYFQSEKGYTTKSNGQGQTQLVIEWTNQHGCGGNEDTDPHEINCNLVLQYMCQDDLDTATGPDSSKHETLRNGIKTDRQNYKPPPNLNENKQETITRQNAVQLNLGLHESFAWYDKCLVRERNRELFTADQILNNNNGLGYSGAIYTRQNPNGNRRGYECPEERDYFPYWHPTPWIDIAVLAENASICQHYTSKSFNVVPYHECVEVYAGTTDRKPYSRWNNETACKSNGGKWTEMYSYLEKDTTKPNAGACDRANNNNLGIRYKWGIPHDSISMAPECLVIPHPLECKESPWSRSNHLGNGRDGIASSYTWVLPHFPSGNTKRCVFRMRYNISTDDYDPHNINSSQNENKMTGVKSPIQQNPYIDIGANSSPLRLAINTAQSGRTFQDRSHVFLLKPRPKELKDVVIHNLNVRGKRGNIVQTYPGVEYDFTPNTLIMNTSDLVHIQWTGSNTHNNGEPAGDGQAGDAGEGKAGTDRSNLVEIGNKDTNYPLPFEKSTMWGAARVVWSYLNHTLSPEDLALNLASSGYYECLTGCEARPGSKAKMNNLLDNAPASYPGVILGIKPGTYNYIGTRNNNFSNRSQKGKLVVK